MVHRKAAYFYGRVAFQSFIIYETMATETVEFRIAFKVT